MQSPVSGLELNPVRFKREGRGDVPTIDIQGKETVAFNELVALAHKAGFTGSEVELLELDIQAQFCLVKATVYFNDGTQYSDIGDATPENCRSKNVAQAYPRMAASRAIGRALRQALNIGTNVAEEFGPDHGDGEAAAARPAFRKTNNTASNGGGGYQRTAASGSSKPFNLTIPDPNDGEGGYMCDEDGCEKSITPSKNYTAEQLAAISVRDFGKVLCWDHGKGRNKG